MGNPILGEIRIFAGLYPPKDWAFCDGSKLTVAGNPALHALLGTQYGGDGVTSFQLPDLRGRLPVGAGQTPQGETFARGQTGGSETVHIDPTMVPAHTHPVLASSQPANSLSPDNASYGTTAANVFLYPDTNKPTSGDRLFRRDLIEGSGGSPRPEPHDNIMPCTAINYIIALQGVYPSR
jgi:microcystin-dependent protein